MKKLLYVLLVVVLSFALFACNPNPSGGSKIDDSIDDTKGGDIGDVTPEEGEDEATKIVEYVLNRVVLGGVPGGSLKWTPDMLVGNGGNEEINFWTPADIGSQYGRIKIYYNGINAAGAVVKVDAASQMFEVIGVVAGQRSGKTETAILNGLNQAVVPSGMVVKLMYPHASDIPIGTQGAWDLECSVTYKGVTKEAVLWGFSVAETC